MNRDEQWLLDEKYGGVRTPEYETDKKRLASGESDVLALSERSESK